ncbi:MAG TPA: DUF2231 domain-containing protein [Burkholderiales bacterium]
METRASIAGHPLHPMLVVFPIGLFVFSFVADLIFLGTRNATWSDVAYYAMAGGILGGVAAAVPGALDLFSMPHSRVRSIGVIHMLINLAVVVLYAINFWVRSGPEPASAGPIWLSAVAVVLLAVSGWLGGEMVYVHGAGVNEAHAQTRARPSGAHAPSPRR